MTYEQEETLEVEYSKEQADSQFSEEEASPSEPQIGDEMVEAGEKLSESEAGAGMSDFADEEEFSQDESGDEAMEAGGEGGEEGACDEVVEADDEELGRRADDLTEDDLPEGSEDGAEETALRPGEAPTAESVVEAVLFASDEPLTAERLAKVVESGVRQIRKHIESLNEKYAANNNSFRIEQIAGGYQMLTLSGYNHWLRKLLHARGDTKLSAAAVETLAIIAYKQPIIRADIESIRGVAAGEMIRGLMYKGLVKIVGRAEVLGRPMLYGTTRKFLEVFGLNSLKDLPQVEELKKPAS